MSFARVWAGHKEAGRGRLVAFLTASAVGCRFWSDPKAAEKVAVVREADKTRSDERRAVLCCTPAKAGNKRRHCRFAGTERSYRESAPQGAAPATGGAMSEHVPLRLRPAPADRNGVAGRPGKGLPLFVLLPACRGFVGRAFSPAAWDLRRRWVCGTMQASSPTDTGQGPAGVCRIPAGQSGNAPLRPRCGHLPLQGRLLGGGFPGGSVVAGGWRDDASIVPYGCGARPCRGLQDTCGAKRQCTPPPALRAPPLAGKALQTVFTQKAPLQGELSAPAD